MEAAVTRPLSIDQTPTSSDSPTDIVENMYGKIRGFGADSPLKCL
jgi:hypothetical protein